MLVIYFCLYIAIYTQSYFNIKTTHLEHPSILELLNLGRNALPLERGPSSSHREIIYTQSKSFILLQYRNSIFTFRLL